MVSTQRPRPRAKQASIDISPNDSLSSTVKSTLSPRTTSFAASINDDDDGDDDFFKKRRRKTGPVLSRPVSFGITEDLMSGDSDDDDEVNHAENAGISSSSEDGSPRRKRTRKQLPAWTKTSSFHRVEKDRHCSKGISSSEDDDDVLVSEHIQGGTNSRRARKATRSPSLTPPPPLDKETLQRLETVLEQYNPRSALEDEEGDDSFTQETQQPLELDPDLARVIRGDRAREIRKRLQEQEAKRMQEEENARRAERARRATQGDAIEVSDSDEEGRATVASTRQRNSSSPVEVVSASFSSRTATQSHPAPAPQQEEEEEEEEERQEEAVAEEVERIGIIMKGGPGGLLKASVKVKATTLMKKLLDHFIEVHQKEIPKGKLRSIRVRFDGEWIDPKATIGELSLEDDDQVDVIW